MLSVVWGLMEDSDRPLRGDGFLVQELDDELILYHPDRTQALCLNATASVIWGLCDGAITVAEIVQLLQDAFPESPSIAGDIREALERFSQLDSIQMA